MIAQALPGSVHRFFMIMDPASQIQQYFFLALIQRPVLFGAYVQQEPASQRDAVAEHTDDLTARFIGIVAGTVSPGIIYGGTEFPFPFRPVNRDSLFGRLIIPIALHP